MPQAPTAPEKVIQIDGVGNIAFPSSMSDTDIEKAAAKLYADANPTKPPPVKSWLSTASDWLPAAGGALGGIVGGIGGTAFGMGVGGVTGAVGGAALGGAAGEGLNQLIDRFTGDQAAPTSATQAARGMGAQGVVQGGTELAGGMVVKGAAKLAPLLMQSAVKPGIKQLANVIRGKEQVPRVVQTMLDEGINVSAGGANKLQAILNANEKELADIIANSKGMVYPEKVASATDALIERFGLRANPRADVAAVRSAADEFMQVHGGAPNLPARPIPVQTAQKMKVETYQGLSDKAYTNELKGAAVEGEKALARGLKEGIEEGVEPGLGPKVKSINASTGRLFEVQEAIGKRVALAANRDPGGIGWIAENPQSFLAFVMARSPMVKSLLARGLYNAAARASKVPENLLRLGVAALATSSDESTEGMAP